MFSLMVLINNDDYSDTEHKIKQLLGRRYSDASGFGFGIRDLEFTYAREADAKKALEKLKKAKLRNVKAKVEKEEEE